MPYTPPKKTSLFFFLSILFISVFYWFVVSLPIQQFKQIYADAPSMVNNLLNDVFPEDLIITINNGEVTINQETPYCLVIDKETNEGIVFDEAADLTTPLKDNLMMYSNLCDPLAVVGRNIVIYSESPESGSYNIQEIPSEVNFQIDQAQVQAIASGVLPILLDWFKTIYYFLPFVMAPFIFLYLLSMNFWYAWVTKIVLKISKINQTLTAKEVRKKTFFVLFIWTMFNWIVIQFLINDLLKIEFRLAFPFLNTIVIAIGVALLEKFVSKKDDGSGGDTNTVEGQVNQIPQESQAPLSPPALQPLQASEPLQTSQPTQATQASITEPSKELPTLTLDENSPVVEPEQKIS